MFADRDGAVDWLHFSKDVEAIMASVVGARRHRAARAQDVGMGAAQARPDDPSVTGVKSYVFSRTLTAIPDKKARARHERRRRLRQEAQGAARQGHHRDERRQLRDLALEGRRHRRNRPQHPPAAARRRAAGVPRSGLAVDLELTECRQLDGGCVFVRYAVKP